MEDVQAGPSGCPGYIFGALGPQKVKGKSEQGRRVEDSEAALHLLSGQLLPQVHVGAQRRGHQGWRKLQPITLKQQPGHLCS